MPKVYKNRLFDNDVLKQDALLKEANVAHLILEDCTWNITDFNPDTKTGLVGADIRAVKLLEIIRPKVTGLIQRKYGYWLRAGYKDEVGSECETILIQGGNIEGLDQGNADYKFWNHDHINIPRLAKLLRIKDMTAKGRCDAWVDGEVTRAEFFNNDLSDFYNIFRQWASSKEWFMSKNILNTSGNHFWHEGSKSILFQNNFLQPIKQGWDLKKGFIETVDSNPLTDPWFETGSPIPIPPDAPPSDVLKELEERIKEIEIQMLNTTSRINNLGERMESLEVLRERIKQVMNQ